MSTPADNAAGAAVDTDERPGLIDAKPVRHPGRWVAVALIAVLVAMMISSLVTNPRWDLGFVPTVMNYAPVLKGLVQGTIVATVGAMLLGVSLGVILAIMRLSDNPVLRGVAFIYTWFFRAIPRLVLLVMLGSGVVYLYPKLDIGLPFGQQLASLFGLSNDMTVGSVDLTTLSSTIIVGILGLGLSEAAYMAEIARAGILSVDNGQREAAQALGMSNGKAMRRVVLPQAMRVIVPPTGNETIAMVKDTALLSAVPIINELWFQITQISNNTSRIMGAYVAGVLWYLIICSVLMVGQHYLEKRFGRGFGTRSTNTRKLSMIGKSA